MSHRDLFTSHTSKAKTNWLIEKTTFSNIQACTCYRYSNRPTTKCKPFSFSASKESSKFSPLLFCILCRLVKPHVCFIRIYKRNESSARYMSGYRFTERNKFRIVLHAILLYVCSFIVEDYGYTRTRGFTRPDPYPRVRVGSGTCSTGTGWVG